MVKQKIIF